MKAFVVATPGASLDLDALRDWTATRLSAFKVPRLVRFVDEWPMSASKIQKFKLRTELLAELGLD